MSQCKQNLIPIYSDNHAVVTSASVKDILGNEIVITASGNQRTAKKAFSCLVEPEIGDRVICTRDTDGTYYIMGIAERPEKKDMRLSFPADTRIEAANGRLNVHSLNALTFASKKINCFSDQTVYKSHDTLVSSNRVTATGGDLQAHFKTVRLISNLINTIARQAIEKFSGYIRSTENVDMVKSGQMTRKSEGLYSLDSQHTLMNSREITKIDGEKILMG